MKFALALPVLAAVALAQPHDHRRRAHSKHAARNDHLHQGRSEKVPKCVIETAWVTETKYVDETTTITYGSEPTEAATTAAAADPEPTDAEFYERPTSTPPASPPAVETPAPAPVVEEPKTSAKPSSAPAPAPVAPQPSAVDKPAEDSSSDSSGSYTYSGSMSYYDLGLGACGEDDSGKDYSDFIVAIAADTMGAQSNGNPMCGKKVNIKAGSKTATATVRDKCPGCSGGAIDASKALFQELFGSLDQGRGNVEWSFSD
ncbi:related to rasp f 7 allergen [Cephalotrichum gorgonifer]|uniref:Related to rasp f 7 allergen n=1 Tax=Cephalotrichum gorgonifer TaxID=2041049 RepID=A0AAE8T029_9PEZI|nr:related to rasp f 7 allergen [Cephalotrichum gorgonifer]